MDKPGAQFEVPFLKIREQTWVGGHLSRFSQLLSFLHGVGYSQLIISLIYIVAVDEIATEDHTEASIGPESTT